MDLAEKNCKKVILNDHPLKGQDLSKLREQVSSDWSLDKNEFIKRSFTFNDFKETMRFVNKVADLAEQEQHHPDMFVGYGKAELEFTTHDVGGLSEKDFIMAAKIDRI